MFLCVILLAGCGYTTRTVLPGNIKTIHVEIFRNDIDITKEVSAKDKYEVYRPGLEVDLRDALTERIFLDGHLKVSSAGYADAVLEGEIIECRKDPLRYQDKDVTEYRVSMVSNVRLRSSKDSEILLEERNVAGDATYFTTGSLQKSETQAVNVAARDLASEIVDVIVENW